MRAAVPPADSARAARGARGARPASVLAPGLSFLCDRFVNVVFAGAPGAADREWVLVDAGVPGSAGRIRREAAARFGAGSRPSAIILTHGHFDRIGAARTLARDWDVHVHAHELELPFVTGRASYPAPDSRAGGGMMSVLSPLFPRGPFDLGSRVRALPADGSVPGLPGWRWLPTPGHSPGHVSLFRDSDGALIAGDAITTTKPESLVAHLTRRPELHGPPAYLTPDGDEARASVRRLAECSPTVVVAGHGPPMRGAALLHALRMLTARLDARAARAPAHHDLRERPLLTA